MWKIVDGTFEKLLVNENGEIKSLLRDGRILKPCYDKKGYLRLRVTINRKKYCFKVHRVVAKAFVPNPEGKPQVNHINGNKSDNRACNLEWVSNIENAHHAIRTGLWDHNFEVVREANKRQMKPVIGTKGGEIRYFKSVCEAQEFVDSRHITDVLKGNRNHVKGWHFRYEKGGDHHTEHNLATTA